ncbi:MAG: peptide chain release factor N(5)-glutamine methyltransferase [Chloroflexi bacterium]|nr:peptide chain release factor N(5)-glutamine methyltransferase [Chloroflexota bacterium]
MRGWETIGRALQQASALLSAEDIDSPRLDAEVLLAHQLGFSREQLLARLDQRLTAEQLEGYTRVLERRRRHEPVAYIVGHREFYGLDLRVDSRVLIPRPETETLVEVAITTARRLNAQRIAEVGTGSGAVAIAVAVHLPQARIYALDVADAALEVARENIARHGVEDRIELLSGDLLTPLPESVQLIVGNLPYISQTELGELPPEVARYEPRQAINGGPNGLLHIRRLLEQAPEYLATHGAICLEMGPQQADSIAALARARFPGAQLALVRDLAAMPRVTLILT